MNSDYGYVYGRVSGMMKHLIDPARMEAIQSSPTPQAFLSHIHDTVYSKWFEDARPQFLWIDGESAVYTHLKDTLDLLASASPEKAAEQFRTLFQMPWDIQDVKSLLHSVHDNLGSGETGILVEGFGVHGFDFWVDLNEKHGKSMDSLVEALPPMFKKMLEPKLQEYSESKNIRLLEDALDKGMVDLWISALEGGFREYAGMRIDRYNLTCIARHLFMQSEFNSTLLRGGLFFTKDLIRVFKKTGFEEIRHLLSQTPYHDAFASMPSGVDTDLIAFEENLERTGHAYIAGKALNQPISEYSLLHYACLKEVEARRLAVAVSLLEPGIEVVS
ncbi:MAG TPA: hypothetical protein ENN13_03585 [Candidatus Altiarchaeales archaeon]|nr:hypothetical protein [Candidatus Altiarchaeales archaeon]